MDKYVLDSNIIINNIREVINNGKSEHIPLFNKNPTKANEDLCLKIDLLNRDINLVQNEYLELKRIK